MMKTINISLPQQLSSRVSQIVDREGYASKSEFFRTLLRLYLSLTVLEKEKELTFLPFKKQPLDQVEKELVKADYNQKFIKSVVKGLEKSSVYANKTTQKRS